MGYSWFSNTFFFFLAIETFVRITSSRYKTDFTISIAGEIEGTEVT